MVLHAALSHLNKSSFRFVLVGAAATALQYVIVLASVELGSMLPATASAFGFAISAVFNYLANRRLTFDSDASHRVAVPRFAAMVRIGLVVTWLCMRLLTSLRWHYLPSQVLTTAIVLLINFQLASRWVFRTREEMSMRQVSPITPARRTAGPPALAIVVPCYNEEAVLPLTLASLRDLLDELRTTGLVSAESYLCFVDDGSSDRTWSMIAAASKQSDDVHGLKLSRNFGHQSAVLAGMLECVADAVVTIDADLQDDERCIAEMLRRYRDGFDIVLGVRSERSSDSRFKRLTAELYYRALRSAGVQIVFNHADFRLLSRRALVILREYSESNLFLRGLIPLIGLPSSIVEYARKERQAGESKYPLRKMLALAWDGVTSFSVMPLRAVAMIGAFIALGSLGVTVWALAQRWVGDVAPGWASTVVPMYFLGGVQILCLGAIGEYVGKIYLETKRRPRYLVEHDTSRRVGFRSCQRRLVRAAAAKRGNATPTSSVRLSAHDSDKAEARAARDLLDARWKGERGCSVLHEHVRRPMR